MSRRAKCRKTAVSKNSDIMGFANGIGQIKVFFYDGFSLFPVLNRHLCVRACPVQGAWRALTACLSLSHMPAQTCRDPVPSSNGRESQTGGNTGNLSDCSTKYRTIIVIQRNSQFLTA